MPAGIRRTNAGPKPDAASVVRAYGWPMHTNDGKNALEKHASVTVEAAARLVDVDVATIRHWSEIGSLEIERRGDMDVVRLDHVRAMTRSSSVGAGRTGTRNGALRALLRDVGTLDTLSVAGLQQLVRDKADEVGQRRGSR